MEVRGSLASGKGTSGKYAPKERILTEKITKNNNPKKLSEKSKPDDGMIELEGGFTMYPSEIFDFSEGTDSWV